MTKNIKICHKYYYSFFHYPLRISEKKKIIPETFYRGQKGDIGLTKSFLDIKIHENINYIKEKYSMYRIKQIRNFRNFK